VNGVLVVLISVALLAWAAMVSYGLCSSVIGHLRRSRRAHH
jgi:hypothetical protein